MENPPVVVKQQFEEETLFLAAVAAGIVAGAVAAGIVAGAVAAGTAAVAAVVAAAAAEGSCKDSSVPSTLVGPLALLVFAAMD